MERISFFVNAGIRLVTTMCKIRIFVACGTISANVGSW